jgi:sugar/nucleoside kinase (ribokinase family)
MLKNIDLLLIADEDITNLQEIKRDFFGILLVHGPDRSTIYFGKEKVETVLEKENFVENLNVLGAGDIFAAVLIYYLLQNKFEDSFDIKTFFLKIKKNIDTIHQKTTQILIDYNKIL